MNTFLSDNLYTLLLILIMAAVTFLIRAIPFVIFKNSATPKIIDYLSNFLPYPIIAMLVVYCLKEVNPIVAPHGIPELLGVLCVAILHIWKRNTLLSIVAGTVCYMLLIHVF